jgi:hypothetical protein
MIRSGPEPYSRMIIHSEGPCIIGDVAPVCTDEPEAPDFISVRQISSGD